MSELIEHGKWKIPVLYEDNHLLCVEKPANLPVQADASGDMDLLNILKSFIRDKYQKPGNVYVGLVHRLDRPVGGCMVFAKTSKAAARLSAQFSDHSTEKKYYAVLQGELSRKTEFTDYLKQNEKTGMVVCARESDECAKKAILISDPISHKDGLTLTEVTLLTGRKHQIRVQHAIHGLSLWGDARYGGGKSGMQIALWAHSLTFLHPTTKESLTIKSTPPMTGAWKVFSKEISKE
ncbi:MAG: RluA family pseudouridine synthase [Clostridia bacterium]|nr:RluA family pseudouridine synthase [Clostridia bacterium]